MAASDAIPTPPSERIVLADDVPIPPRFWWLKRITIASAVLIVALTGLRWWWGYEAHRRLQAEIDRIVAAGEPIYPEDFDSKNTVPDDENAVTALDEAVALLATLSDDEQKTFSHTFEGNWIASHLDEVAPIVEKNRLAIDKLHAARERHETDWHIRFRTPVMTMTMPLNLSGYRQISKLSRIDAMYQHNRGDDAAAIGRLQDTHTMAELLYQNPSLINQLVGWAVDGMLATAIEEICPDIKVCRTDGYRAQEPCAPREEVQQLISQLMEDKSLCVSMRSAILAERMQEVDGATQVPSTLVGALSSAYFAFLGTPSNLVDLAIMPLFEIDAVAIIKIGSRREEIVARGQWKDGKVLVDGSSVKPSGPDSILHPISSILSPSFDYSFRVFFRIRADRQMAATALAIRLYQFDHDGRRPNELAELVPDYLPSVPLDPFADGKLLGYRPDAEPPYLYTVFEDGIDQSGEYRLGPEGYVDRKSLDWPFFLAPHPERERLIHKAESERGE